MSRPRLLDLFCCQGGASAGYAQAGFDVYGVDLWERFTRPRYPFPGHRGDALGVLDTLLRGGTVAFDDGTHLGVDDLSAVAASPPCQAYSITKHSHNNEHPDLVAPVRDRLRALGLPYVIENVGGAPLEAPVLLCGAAFGLTAVDDDGTRLVLKRHRLFESNLLLLGQPCACGDYKRRGYAVGGAYGGGSVDRAHARNVRRGGYTPAKHVRAALLGVDWMTQDAMSQSIPPTYTRYLGEQLLPQLREAAA